MESLLSKRTSINICLWMIRRAALQEAAPTGVSLDCARWDWQFSLPLAWKNNVGFVDKELLRIVHYADGLMQETYTRYHERARFEEAFSRACLGVVDTIEAPETVKDTWRKIARITAVRNRIDTDRAFRLWFHFAGCRDELAGIVEECGGNPRGLELDGEQRKAFEPIRVENALGILTSFYADLILQILLGEISGEISGWVLSSGFEAFHAVSSKKRFAIYGGGAAAGDILPFYLALGFRPEHIWDRAARPGQTLLGVPVTPPSFADIPEEERKDIEVIVAIGRPAPAEEVRRLLRGLGFLDVTHVCEARGAHSHIQNMLAEFFSSLSRAEGRGEKDGASHGE